MLLLYGRKSILYLSILLGLHRFLSTLGLVSLETLLYHVELPAAAHVDLALLR